MILLKIKVEFYKNNWEEIQLFRSFTSILEDADEISKMSIFPNTAWWLLPRVNKIV